MKNSKRVIITGGAGFIGSHLVRYMSDRYPDYQLLVLDVLTYAGRLENIQDLIDRKAVQFVRQDIVDKEGVHAVIAAFQPDWILHLAAESHVDRSIENANDFVKTNVIGTANLLEAFKQHYQKSSNPSDLLFYHCSTDEVYGTLTLENRNEFFTEESNFDPRSPYAASKASSDLFVNAFAHTYQLPVVLSNCSNNYGTHQYPEKLIPVVINACVHDKPIPVYGNGQNVRDWIHVTDHVRAIDMIAHSGKTGRSYNVGANQEMVNIDLVKMICKYVDEICQKPQPSERLISFVKDRLGHDVRYGIDNKKITQEIGWKPLVPFETGLKETVAWYVKQFTK